MADDKLMLEAHEALHDMIQWVAVFAAAAGSHGVVMKSPRMAKAQAVLEKLDRAAGVAPSVAPSYQEVIAAALEALEDNDNHAATVILKTAAARGVDVPDGAQR